MPNLGLGTALASSGLVTPGIVTSNLVMKHNYAAGSVVPLSDGSAYFDGTNSKISMGDVLDFGTDDFSITAWVKFPDADVASQQAIVSKFVDANTNISLRLGTANKFIITAKAEGNTVIGHAGDAVVDALEGTWVHLAFTCDRDGLVKLYVNGSTAPYGRSSSSAESSQNLSTGNTGDLTFGINSADGEDFEGHICNVGIWHEEALTEVQVKSIMNKKYSDLTTSESDNLVGWWALDEGSGTTAVDSKGSNNGSLS